MSDAIITVENLSKKYLVGHKMGQQGRSRYVALRDVIGREIRNATRKTIDVARGRQILQGDEVEEFWALKDVSFEVKRGEVLGIIGRNGAGKSTLLKILSRITEPTEGRVTLRGRVASLLEVGTGFHPELTGRENIFLNGAILGMTRAEIKRKFDEIVAFAEVAKFLDTPVKHYSSGMYVRLAFAVAAHLEPDILIVDEVLAVGDADFQRKCFGKMEDVAKGGQTVLLVSHNMGAVRNLANSCIWIAQGSLILQGQNTDVVDKYLRHVISHSIIGRPDLNSCRREQNPSSPAKIISITLSGHPETNVVPTLEIGGDWSILITIDVFRRLSATNVTLILKNSAGHRVLVLVSWDQETKFSWEAGRSTIVVELGRCFLSPETYSVDVGIDQSMEVTYDAIFDFPLFTINNTGQVAYWTNRPWGTVHLNSVNWRVVENSPMTFSGHC
jgi:lipopolysaccharide transport system ATP-binding protein